MYQHIFRPRLSDFDLEVFDAFVPADHFLRQALAVIPWDEFDDLLSEYYSPDMGRPPEWPTLMLKLQYLCYHCRLSDRQVIDRAKTDIAFRFFLQVDVNSLLPAPSSLSRFRGRLGKDGFRDAFDKIVATAREHGLVRDRLRLKDASHVIANIAIPSTLGLVAQTRDKLLAAAEPFDPIRVEGERINIDLLRESSQGQSNEVRLEMRATHLQEILAWIEELPAPKDVATNRDWEKLVACCKLAHKILNDQENPKGEDKTWSVVDPEARRGKHGDWYDGYLVDIFEDADSEIVTQVNVMPANGEEAADAIALLTQEEEAHGNDVDTVSIDGAGFNGPVLRELEDPEGLNVDVIVPPKAESTHGLFTPDDFAEDTEQGVVTCPAEQTSRYRQRDAKQRTTIYRFPADVCKSCALLKACMENAPKKFGRSVRKNDYQEEYARVRQKATTDKYAEVRREHPKVERKLGEILNCHGGRQARYWGVEKVTVQELLATMATNVKRIVHLVCAPTLQLEPQA